MGKPTLTFKSAIPQGAVLTYAFTDSKPGAKPCRFSLAHDSIMEHDCSDDVPPWAVAYFVNEDKSMGQLLSHGQFQVAQGDSTITVSHGYYFTVDPSSASPPAGAWAADMEDASLSSKVAEPSSLPQAGTSAVSPEQAAGFSAPHADAAAIVTPPQPSLQAEIAGYVQQMQSQTQWCWAAVASSVAAFYAPPDPDFSQCRLACWATGADSCCSDGSSATCNLPQRTGLALRHVGHQGVSRRGRLAYAEIRSEIDARRPIVATVSWAGGGHHAVVITGYTPTSNGPFLTVRDPADASTTLVALDDFPQDGTWSWTHTTHA